MNKKSKVDWGREDVIEIISNSNLSLKEMSSLLGCSIWYISRKRKKLNLKPLIGVEGERIATTNKERKAKYNAKIKEHNYLPIYKWI